MRNCVVPAILIVWLVPGAGRIARAQTTEARQGRELYQQYCASCHGEQAKGDGPAASAFNARPPDLTTIAKRAGAFSAAAVEAVIKGVEQTDAPSVPAPTHEPIPAHGSYTMPVWGPYFLEMASSASEAQLRVTSLVRYLESIQAK